MFFCYMVVNRNGQVKSDLCIVPDKADSLSLPIVVRELFVTTAAVFRVGAEEALIVFPDEQDGSMVITAMEPAAIYLTPNLPQFPGVRVRRVKIMTYGEGSIKTFVAKDRNSAWEEYVANKERR